MCAFVCISESVCGHGLNDEGEYLNLDGALHETFKGVQGCVCLFMMLVCTCVELECKMTP